MNHQELQSPEGELNGKELSEMAFEAAFARLEVILERLNTGATTLDESLTLYEEADRLIAICSKRLNDAERKIEILVKNRNGELVCGPDNKPAMQEFR